MDSLQAAAAAVNAAVQKAAAEHPVLPDDDAIPAKAERLCDGYEVISFAGDDADRWQRDLPVAQNVAVINNREDIWISRHQPLGREH